MKTQMTEQEIRQEMEELRNLIEVNEIKELKWGTKITPAPIDENDYVVMISSMLPRKFMQLYLGDFKDFLKQDKLDIVREYLCKFWNNLIEGRGFLFVGPVGTGKTAITTLILKYAYLFFKRSDFFRAYKKTMMGNFPEVPIYFWQSGKFIMDYFRDKENFNWILSHPVLAIDDITKVTQDIYKEAFDYALRFREMNSLPTILVSQMPLEGSKTKDGLLQFFGNPVYDLIKGNCDVLKLIGKSKRGKQGDG